MLSASHVSRRFGDRIAVDDLSFDLAAGEILALLGPNGAGKTTTLRMLAGLIEPTSGTIQIRQETLTHGSAPRLRSGIGFLPELPGLWDRMSVQENLLTYARIYGVTDAERAVDESLTLLDVRDRADDLAAELSKGLKQRVAIARALLHRPEIVLLDEPTAGLDPASARDVRGLVLRLRSEHRTVVLSTHNLDEVERVADRVAVMRTQLVALDTPAALGTLLFGTRVRVTVRQPAASFTGSLADAGFAEVRPDGQQLLIGINDREHDIPAIVRCLVNAGADVMSVTTEHPSLEQVYLRLVEGT